MCLVQERDYICFEARSQFRHNMSVSNLEQIEALVSRISSAVTGSLGTLFVEWGLERLIIAHLAKIAGRPKTNKIEERKAPVD
jgi:hypothetical protein